MVMEKILLTGLSLAIVVMLSNFVDGGSEYTEVKTNSWVTEIDRIRDAVK